ncbi:hypothetical protein SSS_07761 [Sarcoptes scabiei]|uniref:Uncharacterized protein n=1 Tax=Sarcoptes scabiei TaxID=52283 RepID=A0A834VER9_SARSC|nr:hypothetical protein SSS_07761 [Sarcoptes scabiei]
MKSIQASLWSLWSLLFVVNEIHYHQIYCEELLIFHQYNLHHAEGDKFYICDESQQAIFLDYTLQFNSFVAICRIGTNLEIRIQKIASDEEQQLQADRLRLDFIVSKDLDRYRFTLDRFQGLLYYTDGQKIDLLDLKKTILSTFNLYKTSGSRIINKLLLRPDLVRLVWLESDSNFLNSSIYEADQNGKNLIRLKEIPSKIMTDLLFHNRSEYLIALMQQTDPTRSGIAMRIENLNETKHFEIQSPNSTIREVHLYQDRLIFLVTENQKERDIITSVRINDLIEGRKRWPTLMALESKRKISTFLIYERESRWRLDSTNSPCHNNICKRTEFDFCIPINQTHSQCSSGELFALNEDLDARFFTILTIGILFALILLIFLIYFLFFSKQKSRFYQIRLKKLKRVESSKLQVKPPATEEIAE